MAILLDHVQAIFSALQMKNTFCYIGEGHEVCAFISIYFERKTLLISL